MSDFSVSKAFIRVNIRVDWISSEKKMKKQFRERITMMRIIMMIKASLSQFEIFSSFFSVALRVNFILRSLFYGFREFWEDLLHLRKRQNGIFKMTQFKLGTLERIKIIENVNHFSSCVINHYHTFNYQIK